MVLKGERGQASGRVGTGVNTRKVQGVVLS